MKIKNVTLNNFRLIKDEHIDLDNNCIIFVGNNASGKTTIVESLYYCCFFTSFRAKKQAELISLNEKHSAVKVNFEHNQTKQSFIETYFTADERNIVLNRMKNQKRTEVMGKLNIVLLTPNLDEYVTGTPRERRKFLDMGISQFDQQYRLVLLAYNQVTKQRAAILKSDEFDSTLFEIIDTRYEQLAATIRQQRIAFLQTVHHYSQSIIKIMSENTENVQFKYVQGKKALLDQERRLRKNLSGAQYDDFQITINDMDAKTYGSQGQQRSIAMALVLSQIEILKLKTGEYPVVIIDDVHVELDKVRQQLLFQMLDEKVQTIYVTTDLQNIPATIAQKALIYRVETDNKLSSKVKKMV